MARTIPRGWKDLEVKDFLKFTPRGVEKPKEPYLSLGLRSHCKGTFIREVENPEKVMMDTLYAVKKDDFIVNITFAWEGAVALVKKSNEGALVSHRFPTYVFDRNVVIPEYFRYWIPSKRFVSELGIISPGGAGRNRVLDRTDFMYLRFVMPPVDEQKKIAQIILVWDRAIEIVNKAIDVKDRRFKSFLHTLTSPKKGMCGWGETSLGEIGEIIKGKGITKADLCEAGVPCIRYADLYTKYDFIVSEITSYVSPKVARSCQPLKMGDIIFAGSGETAEDIGKCVAYLNKNHDAVVGGDTLVLRQEKCDANYLAYALNSPMVNRQKSVFGHGHSVVHLYGKDIKNIRLSLPPIKEQKRNAIILNAAKHEIDILRRVAERFSIQKHGLIQKLLTGKIRVKV